jgi:hypothetical protein
LALAATGPAGKDCILAAIFPPPARAVRELLNYFGENGIGMKQLATSRPKGLNRRKNVTAAAATARAAA